MDKNNDIIQQAIDDRIDAFIRGMMTEEEEAAFKQEIQADPDLRAHVLATVSLIKGIRSQGALKEKDIIRKNAYNKQTIRLCRSESANRARTLLWWATSIAAVFAIFFGYSKDKRYNELSALVSPYYTEYSMDDYARGDIDSTKVANLYTLFNNIQNQRHVSNIIAELEPIYTSLEHDFTYSAYANDIALNLALAYIKDDQADKAIPILEKLEKDNPDTPIAAKAQEVLKKLRKE
jgi:hypothetical protein